MFVWYNLLSCLHKLFWTVYFICRNHVAHYLGGEHEQEGTQMQEESLKIVSDSSSCREQLVGRKWSPEPPPFLPPSPLCFPTAVPISACFSTPFAPINLSFPAFTIISSPGQQCTHLTQNAKTKPTRRWPDPLTGAWRPLSPPRELLRATWGTQSSSRLRRSTPILNLLFLCHFSAQG